MHHFLRKYSNMSALINQISHANVIPPLGLYILQKKNDVQGLVVNPRPQTSQAHNASNTAAGFPSWE